MAFRPSRWIRGARALLRFGRPIGLALSAEVSVRGSFEFGKRVSIGARSLLQVPEGTHLELGEGVYIGRDVEITPATGISIGRFTSFQDRCVVLGEVSVGANCLFAPNVFVSSGTHRFSERPAELIKDQDLLVADPAYVPKEPRHLPIDIGEDCWVGANAVVMRGVTIGRGCIIGANAVVTADVAPYSIVAGAPARPIGKRLEFRPPALINADDPEHLPYFYRGFCQRMADRGARPGVLRARGAFAVDVERTRARTLRIGLAGDASGTLRFAAQQQRFGVGNQELRFELAGIAAAGPLCFEARDEAGRPAVVAIRHVGAEA